MHTEDGIRDEHGDRGQGSEAATAALQAAQGNDDSRCLIAFDFDRTIMKEHMWKKYKETPLANIHITDDLFVDLAQFRALVFALRQQGHHVAVVTFGRRDVIDKALHFAFGYPHEISVRTPADFGQKDGSGLLGDKNTHLASLADRYHISASHILLIDDDKQNIEAAAKAGVYGQWVPNGLRGSVVERVFEQVGVEPMCPEQASEIVMRNRRCRLKKRDTGYFGELPDLDPESVCTTPTLSLQQVFASITGGLPDMDSKTFARLCKDCQLFDIHFVAKDAEAIFVKVASKGQRSMNFSGFETALAFVARQKGAATEYVHAEVCANIASAGSAREAGASRLSPKSSNSLAGRGVSKEAGYPAMVVEGVAKNGAKSVQDVFESYCGALNQMDSRTFSKVCKESYLLDKKFMSADVDVIFAKVLPRGQRKLTFHEFETALGFVARRKNIPAEAVYEAVRDPDALRLSGPHPRAE